MQRGTDRVALVMNEHCALHDTGWGHPEHQGRLRGLAQALERDTPQMLEILVQREGVPVEEPDLLRVHRPDMVAAVRDACERARSSGAAVALDADTVASGASWEAALAAAGCARTAVEAVVEGHAAGAFAASRPPGHHATSARAMGFCLFNNVAVAARWAQSERGVGRVLIVDWDVHHGNGTQEIFWTDDSVFYLSLHLWPHYPGTGAADETGAGRGAGFTHNVPLPHGVEPKAYHAAYEQALERTLARFHPELVLVSAGFDCLAGDPLGGMRLEPRDLHRMMTLLRDATAPWANGRIVAALEGGYVPQRLGAGALDVIRALAGVGAREGDSRS